MLVAGADSAPYVPIAWRGWWKDGVGHECRVEMSEDQ
jgi:hypothetical protein